MENTLTLKTNLNCGSCVAKVTPALNALSDITHWEVDTANPDKLLSVSGKGLKIETLQLALQSVGFEVKGFASGSVPAKPISFWADKPLWNRASFNTLNCLIGCTIGDFGMMIYLQAYYTGMNPWIMMALAMATGLTTSVMLETVILKIKESFSWSQSLQTAFGMSFISMLVMEFSENITDYLLTGNAVPMHHPFFWQALGISAVMGFLVPLPYNYFKIKKYGKSCH